MNWCDIYNDQIEKKGGILKYSNYKISHKQKLINTIKKYAKNRIIEVGCGTGIIVSNLASMGYEVYGIDINKDILKLASEIEKKCYEVNKAIFRKQSLFALNFGKDYFDVSFSCGVLEHFSDSKIVDAIKSQLSISRHTIIVIPTKYFNPEEALQDGENKDRFLSLKHWRGLIDKSGGTIIEERSYHHHTLFKIIIELNKYFRPMPYRIFVLSKK